MILEAIEENANCRESDMMRFREIGPPRQVVTVRLYHEALEGKEYSVTGWSDQGATPAFVRPVEDSGSGVSYLLYGGNCGLRFGPKEAIFRLSDPAQWGEPFLLLSNLADVTSGTPEMVGDAGIEPAASSV